MAFHDNFGIVLIETADSRNIGSVARAMANLGFSDLRLVSPRNFDLEQARVTARNASPIIEEAGVFDAFPDAIADATAVVGFALPKSKPPHPPHFLPLDIWAKQRALSPAAGGKTLLVFGPEADDLRREHLEMCRYVVTIASSAQFPSFNVAQSVLLALYEIDRNIARAEPQTPRQIAESPTENDRAQIDRLLESVMAKSGFVREGTPAPAPATVRNVLRRTDLTRREARLLLALLSRIDGGLTGPTPVPSEMPDR